MWEEGRVAARLPGAGGDKGWGYVAYVLYAPILEGYVRTLTYAILAYVNKNRVRAWQCIAIGNAFVGLLQTGIR